MVKNFLKEQGFKGRGTTYYNIVSDVVQGVFVQKNIFSDATQCYAMVTGFDLGMKLTNLYRTSDIALHWIDFCSDATTIVQLEEALSNESEWHYEERVKCLTTYFETHIINFFSQASTKSEIATMILQKSIRLVNGDTRAIPIRAQAYRRYRIKTPQHLIGTQYEWEADY